jgi:hypothetical protein
MSLPLAGPGTSTARFHRPKNEFPPTHQREFQMSISVTENASCVTDVMALLSSLGYDTASSDTASAIVIDRFDHWRNRTDARALICGTSVDFGLKAA